MRQHFVYQTDLRGQSMGVNVMGEMSADVACQNVVAMVSQGFNPSDNVEQRAVIYLDLR